MFSTLIMLSSLSAVPQYLHHSAVCSVATRMRERLSSVTTLFGQEVLLANMNLYEPDLFENVKSAGGKNDGSQSFFLSEPPAVLASLSLSFSRL